MKRREIALMILSLCLSLILAGGAWAQEGTGGEPRNVIALSRSIAELWLLSGGELCGVTEDALDLEGISEGVASIGSLAHPSTEAVLALDPGLVLMTLDMPAHKTLAQELEELQIPIRVIDIENFAGYDEQISYLSGLTGREDLYEQNVVQVRARIDEILAKAQQDLSVEGSFLCMRISATKNRVMKKDFFTCEIIGDFGLTNIADDSNALDELNLEAIAVADPDWIFVIPMGDDETARAVYEELFTSQPVWDELSATRNGRVNVLPSELFMYKPNARWDEAYQYMYDLLGEK